MTSLLWFIFRTGTKPSRVVYPCQRAALANSSLLLSISIPLSLTTALTKTRKSTSKKGATLALLLIAASVVISQEQFWNIAFSQSRSSLGNHSVMLDLKPHSAITRGLVSDLFFVQNASGVEGRMDGALEALFTLMSSHGYPFYETSSNPSGLIGKDDVVIVKVNGQWAERGGTNTDLLKSLIQNIVDHPEGFEGEIVVADNAQKVAPNWIDRTWNNAYNTSQSFQDVVDMFSPSYKVSSFMWDSIRDNAVLEYEEGDMSNGYFDSQTPDPNTGLYVTYPKFQTIYGTYISLKKGIWNPTTDTYTGNLKLINMPVLKSHYFAGVTAATKHYMGVVSQSLHDNHLPLVQGGMGTEMAQTRFPTLNLLDAIYVNANPHEAGSWPPCGPPTVYADASYTNIIGASTDPVALDYWSSKYILMPTALDKGYSEEEIASINPDLEEVNITDWPWTYMDSWHNLLNRTMNQLKLAGYQSTMSEDEMNVYVYPQTTSGYLVVRGLNNRINYRLYNSSNGSWESWNVLPSGYTCDSPASTVCCGKLHIVVRGFSATNIFANNTLWYGWIDLTDLNFSGWTRLGGATTSAPTLVSHDDTLILTVRGKNNRIYYRSYDCTSDEWEAWTALPSGTTCDSPAAEILDNELHIVVRGFSVTSVAGNRSLYHGSVNLTTGVFSGWNKVSGATESAPTLTASETLNTLSLVVRGLNNRIYHNTWNGTDWEGWTALPKRYSCDSPGAAVLGDELHIVVRGFSNTSVSTNRSLWHCSVTFLTGSFSGWTGLSGETESAPTLAASQTPNKIYLVVRGLNNRIHYRLYNSSNGSWESWNLLPSGTTCDSPGAAVLGDELHIVVRGFSVTSVAGNRSLYHGSVNLTTGVFSGWNKVSGATESAPTLVASQTLNRVYLIVRELDNAIYYNTWNGSEWESWNVLPSGITCDSPAVAIIDDKLHVVVRGFSKTSVYGNHSLWHGYVNLTDGGFSGWTRVSGQTPSAPALTISGSSLYLVVRGMNNRIYYNVWNDGWDIFMVVPSGTTGDTPAAAVLNRALHIVVRGKDSTGLWHGYVNLTDGGFFGWTRLAGATPSAPTLTS